MSKRALKLKLDRFTIKAGSLGRIPSVSMNPAYSGGLLLLPGFDCPVVIDLSGLSDAEQDQNIPILRNHNPDREIGHTEKIRINGFEVEIDGKLSFDNSDVRDIVQTNKAGKRWQVSVGSGSVPASMQQFIPEGESVTVNGQDFTGPLIIVKTPIREVSFVPAGADLHNAVEIHASTLKESSTMTFETWAAEKGFNLEGMDEASVEALRLIFETETVPADTENPGGVEAEGTEKDDEKDKDKPVNAGGLRVPRRSNFGTASVGTSQSTSSAKVIEASLLMSGGIDDRQVESLGYDQRTIDQAVSAGNRGIGLQALFHRVIRASGMHYPGGMHDNDFIRTAFDASEQLQRRGIRASGIGFSTVHLPGILGNVANKRLLAAYRHVDPSCLKIAYIASNNDFKEHAYYQFEMDGALREVSSNGQLQHVGLQETEYKTKLETKGAIVSLTRQMIINDDLEAFLRIPNEYGRKTAQGLDHAFYKAMYENIDVLFNADHNNLISGADSILSGMGYTLATQKFAEQKDKGGGFIMATPRYVVGAPALLPTAKRLFVSQTLNETTTPNEGQPNANIWESAYEPIVTPWMSESAGLGGTDKDWMLISDPNDVAFMQVAFLKGQRNPTIESGEMDFSVLGMSWRCFYDFGIGLMNPQGAVYSVGE